MVVFTLDKRWIWIRIILPDLDSGSVLNSTDPDPLFSKCIIDYYCVLKFRMSKYGIWQTFRLIRPPTRFCTYRYILHLKCQNVKDTVGKIFPTNKQNFYFELEIEGLHQDSIHVKSRFRIRMKIFTDPQGCLLYTNRLISEYFYNKCVPRA
jgi:hypothetical protein